jgi:hypothetical protein
MRLVIRSERSTWDRPTPDRHDTGSRSLVSVAVAVQQCLFSPPG